MFESWLFALLLGILIFGAARLMRCHVLLAHVPARYESVRALMGVMAQFARHASLGDWEAYACRLALDEACVNIIEHAYNSDPEGVIEVYLCASPGLCEIRLTDFGEPYDPREVAPPAISVDLIRARPGGLGLHLMRQVMDKVDYAAGPAGNLLVMIKRRAE